MSFRQNVNDTLYLVDVLVVDIQSPNHPWLMKQLFPKDTPSKFVFCPLIYATSHSPFLIITKAITEATRWGVRIIIQPWLWGFVAAAFRAGGVLIPSSACRAFLFPNRAGYLNVVAYLRSSKCAHDFRIAQPESAVKSVTYGKKGLQVIIKHLNFVSNLALEFHRHNRELQ